MSATENINEKHHESLEYIEQIPKASFNPNADLDHVLAGDERAVLTEADNRRIRRKTDKVVLTLLIWVYFLQVTDKTVLGYGSIFGLQTDTGLVGNQYSLVGSIAPIAQLIWLPFSSVLVVKVPHRILMPALILGWGIATCCMAACTNYAGLLACRFFLGLFEAGCLPLFSIITSQWYRRSEQPLRVAAWYGMNGFGTIFSAALSFGLGHIPTTTIHSWRIIFLFVGLMTIVTVPVVYWRLDNDIPSARFLNDHERAQAVERLRANQTGIGNNKLKWDHIKELLLEPKTYLWFAMALLLNVGAHVTTTFGPLILSGLGFDKYLSSLLNMPFGAVQFLVIIFSSYAVQKAKIKSVILIALVLPVVAGLAMLYTIPHTSDNTGPLIAAYYLLAFLFGGNPLIVSWIVGNTAGTTKKSAIMSLYNAGASAGAVIGPILFNSADAPAYIPGLRTVLILFITLVVIVLFQLAYLVYLNKLQSKKRVSNGKKAVLHDNSMDDKYTPEENADATHVVGEKAFLDLTDRKNDEFIYLY